jgi:hypothetical protein
MNLQSRLFIAAVLVALPGCEQQPNSNRSDGINDAIGARPYEEIRDAGEELGAEVKDVGRDLKDAVNGK